jgi:hypothetical protein
MSHRCIVCKQLNGSELPNGNVLHVEVASQSQGVVDATRPHCDAAETSVPPSTKEQQQNPSEERDSELDDFFDTL